MLLRRPPSCGCSGSRGMSMSGSGRGGGGAWRSGAEEGVLEDAHVGGDRGVGPGGAGRRHGHVVRWRGAVEDGVVVRVGHLVVVVVVDRRGAGDGGCDGGRADLLEAHGGGLGLLLLLERRRGTVRVLLLLLGRRRGRGPGGELLDHVAEVVLADVVDLRLGVRRAGGLSLLLLLRRGRRRGLADVPAELVDAEVLVVGAAAATAAAAAVHDGRSAMDLPWAEERGAERRWGEGGGGGGGREAHAMEFVSKLQLQRGFFDFGLLEALAAQNGGAGRHTHSLVSHDSSVRFHFPFTVKLRADLSLPAIDWTAIA